MNWIDNLSQVTNIILYYALTVNETNNDLFAYVASTSLFMISCHIKLLLPNTIFYNYKIIILVLISFASFAIHRSITIELVHPFNIAWDGLTLHKWYDQSATSHFIELRLMSLMIITDQMLFNKKYRISQLHIFYINVLFNYSKNLVNVSLQLNF